MRESMGSSTILIHQNPETIDKSETWSCFALRAQKKLMDDIFQICA